MDRVTEATRTISTERQVGALCWRVKKERVEILLVTSRETKRWVIPKGWPMENLTDWNAARREAFEEAGVEGHMHKHPIGHYHYDKRKRNGTLLPTCVDVYSFEVSDLLKSWPEKKERKRVWYSREEASTHVVEPELKQLITGFQP
jgi:8-oxo-dGTP pyrophosphatase MutT (NUDIX family)